MFATPILERIPLVQRVFLFAFKSKRQLQTLPYVTSSWGETMFYYGAESFFDRAIDCPRCENFSLTDQSILFRAAHKLSLRYVKPLILLFWSRDPSPPYPPSTGTKLDRGNLFAVQFGHNKLKLLQALVRNRKYNNEIFEEFLLDFMKENLNGLFYSSTSEVRHHLSSSPDKRLAQHLLLKQHPVLTFFILSPEGLLLLALALKYNCKSLYMLLIEGALKPFFEESKLKTSKHINEVKMIDAATLIQHTYINAAIQRNDFELFKLLTSFNETNLIIIDSKVAQFCPKFGIMFGIPRIQRLRQLWKESNKSLVADVLNPTIFFSCSTPSHLPICVEDHDNCLHKLFEFGRLDFVEYLMMMRDTWFSRLFSGMIFDPKTHSKNDIVFSTAASFHTTAFASVNHQTPFIKAINSKHLTHKQKVEVAEFIINKLKLPEQERFRATRPHDEASYSSVFVYNEFGHRRLRSRGRDSPIHIACRDNNVELLKLLLEPKNLCCLLDISFENFTGEKYHRLLAPHYTNVLNQFNSIGYTPLMLCATNKSTDCARLLLTTNFQKQTDEATAPSSSSSSHPSPVFIDVENTSRWLSLSAIQLINLQTDGSQEIKNMMLDYLMSNVDKYRQYDGDKRKLRESLSFPQPPLTNVGHMKHRTSLLIKLIRDQDVTAIQQLFKNFPKSEQLLHMKRHHQETPFIVVCRDLKNEPGNTNYPLVGKIRVDILKLLIAKEVEAFGGESLLKEQLNDCSRAFASTPAFNNGPLTPLEFACELFSRGEERSVDVAQLVQILVRAGARTDRKINVPVRDESATYYAVKMQEMSLERYVEAQCKHRLSASGCRRISNDERKYRLETLAKILSGVDSPFVV